MTPTPEEVRALVERLREAAAYGPEIVEATDVGLLLEVTANALEGEHAARLAAEEERDSGTCSKHNDDCHGRAVELTQALAIEAENYTRVQRERDTAEGEMARMNTAHAKFVLKYQALEAAPRALVHAESEFSSEVQFTDDEDVRMNFDLFEALRVTARAARELLNPKGATDGPR